MLRGNLNNPIDFRKQAQYLVRIKRNSVVSLDKSTVQRIKKLHCQDGLSGRQIHRMLQGLVSRGAILHILQSGCDS